MVEAVRRGRSQRDVAREFGVSLLTVQRWCHRAGTRRVDRVVWDDRSHAPWRTRRTPPAVEEAVLGLRTALKDTSALGEFGAPAIQRELAARHPGQPVPSVATIGRILERRGALDGQRRIRRPPPPRGWYLPDVAAGHAELDSFDIIEGLVIQGGLQVEILTGISLWGHVATARTAAVITAARVAADLTAHWRQVGCPHYAQFDNDTCFQGAHQHRDSFSRVVRLCLSLHIVPVFAPVRETGFQALIEHFNGLWQAKVWQRFRFLDYADLQGHSDAYIAAHRARTARQADTAARRPLPDRWHLDLQAALRGRVIYLRRTTDTGTVSLLGRSFAVDAHWTHRLVRCEVDLDAHCIRFHALRRRDPSSQPLLCITDYDPPTRRFIE